MGTALIVARPRQPARRPYHALPQKSDEEFASDWEKQTGEKSKLSRVPFTLAPNDGILWLVSPTLITTLQEQLP
jgi:hypothetical protein